MALSISIALSGLERTDFTNYEKLFDRGEEIVNRHLTAPPPPPPIAPSVRQRSSSSSSESTFQNGTVYSSSACSEDSQSSTIKKDSSEWYPPPLSLRDYCMFRIDMAESDTEEKFKMLEVYDSAASSPKPKETEEAKNYIMRRYEETSKWSEVKSEIRWENRNLLDLSSNLKGTLNMFQPITYLKTESSSNHPNPTKPRHPCKNCGFKD